MPVLMTAVPDAAEALQVFSGAAPLRDVVQRDVFRPVFVRAVRAAVVVFEQAVLRAAEQDVREMAWAAAGGALDAVDEADMPEVFVRQGADPGAFEGFSAR